MSINSLTEAYSEIYDHRKVEELFDNLRFVDYMQLEDIEQVVEELVWEFRDYGNTLEEAFDMIDHASSDDIICESYDELIDDILYEATVTSSDQRGSRGVNRPNITRDKDTTDKVLRRSERIGKIRTANRSVKSRISKLSGPVSSVKQAISGSAGGIGRAAKSLGGKVVEKGKAMLKSLLRRGGKAMSSVGKAIESRGKSTSQAGLDSRRAGRTSRSGQMSLDFNPSTKEKTGGTMSKVGRAVRKVGVALQRKAGKKDSPKMTRSEYEDRKTQRTASAKSEVGNAFAKPKVKALPAAAERKALPPYRGLKPNTPGRVEVASSGGIRSRSSAPSPRQQQGPPPVRALPPKGAGTFTSGGNRRPESQRKLAMSRAATQGRRALNKEDLEYILSLISEDLISAGYAHNENDAYDYINELEESLLLDIISDYLEE
jgi:hypothetical protein